MALLTLNSAAAVHPSAQRGFFKLTLLSAALMATIGNAMAAPEVARSVKVDENVYEIAFNSNNQAVYAAVTGERVPKGESSEGKVSAGIVVLDANTLKQVNKIATGKVTPFGLAINNQSQKLYAIDTPKGQVAVYDVDSGKELALIESTGDESKHLRQAVIDEKNNKIYVSAVGGMERDGKVGPKSAVWVIDGTSDKIESVIIAPVTTAAGLALDVEQQRLYVSDLSKNEIAEVDLKTQKVLRTFVSAEPSKDGSADASNTINLELDAKNQILYAINQKSGGVALIDLKDGNILKTVKTGSGALSAALNPKSGDLYVANRGDGTVSVIDGETHFVTAHLSTGIHPQTVAVDPKTGQVYVSNKAKGKGRGAGPEVPTPVEATGNTVTLITP